MVATRPKAVKSTQAKGVPTAMSSPPLVLRTGKIQESGCIACRTALPWRETEFARFATLAIVLVRVSIVKSIQEKYVRLGFISRGRYTNQH
jgi:hypothetical protein